jgi:hypothetical protein
MSDLLVTSNSVVAANANTVIARGTAGAQVNAGQAVWADPSASYQLKPAQATNQTQAANIVGIALNTAGNGQPLAYATGGDITLPTSGGGTTMIQGGAYVLSAANSGGIAPVADLTTGNWVTLLGVATSATNFRLGLIISGAQK